MTRVAGTLEVRTLPDDTVYLWETNAQWQQYNGLLHGICVVNRSELPIRIDSIEIEVLNEDDVMRSWRIPNVGLRSAARSVSAMNQQGLLQAYNYVFQLRRLLPPEAVLSESEELEPNAVLVLLKQRLEIPAASDSLRITVRGLQGSRQETTAAKELEISKGITDALVLPVRGTWLVRVGPSFHTHHRWAPPDEFALDLAQCGRSGTTYERAGSALSDHYAFGQDVLAVAAGEIVEAVGSAEDRPDLLGHSDESDEAYYARFGVASAEMLKTDPISGCGNYIVIRHGPRLFSCYAHLMHESLRVQEGDRVEAGRLIASVGQTGSSPSPHLHFKVCEGANPLVDRSLPARFGNIRVVGRPNSGYLHSGDLVRTI